MPRKKGYDRETLVASAMRVFHQRGFKGASTEVLVQELGVNRNSVYSEFGSKEGLFAAALGLYEKRVVNHLFQPLESANATLDDIEKLYRTFAESAADSSGLGCLMCNTAAELGGREPRFQPLVTQYFERLHNAFCNSLRGAARAGQVAPDIAINTEASFFTSCCVGIFLMVRADVATSTVQESIEGALNHLHMLRSTRPNIGQPGKYQKHA